MLSRLSCAVAVFTLPLLVRAEVSIEQKWKEFHANPKAFMMKQPEKTGATSIQKFTPAQIRSGEFIDIKAKARAKHLASGSQNLVNLKSEALFKIEDFIDPRDLGRTGGRLVKRLGDMEAMKLKDRYLQVQPWSDWYWPMDSGMLGSRYSSSQFQQGRRRWKGYADFIQSPGNTLAEIYKRGDINEIAALSPSEKYDLMIGNLQYGNQFYQYGYLTPKMWEQTSQFVEKEAIEEWMGICQGWAAASFMLPRPATTAILTAADGKTQIPFLPSDLKGLASFQWANGNYETAFFGSRCDGKNVRRDQQTGRVLDEECFDLNPANFHLALVNQIGVAGKSMVLDATFDYEVWNHPIYSYRYRYFNPQTGAATDSLEKAVVFKDQFTNDKFAKFRSPKAHAFVGIMLELTYVIETEPNTRRSDDPKYDAVNTVQYMYDLEVDSIGQPLGGEWYSDAHPDFLWKPIRNTRSTSPGDRALKNPGNWDTNDPIPAFWRDIAIRNALKHGMPLYEIVERLMVTSHLGQQLRFEFDK